MLKKVPGLTTDVQAERFLGQDLSGLNLSQFKPARFEFWTYGKKGQGSALDPHH